MISASESVTEAPVNFCFINTKRQNEFGSACLETVQRSRLLVRRGGGGGRERSDRGGECHGGGERWR